MKSSIAIAALVVTSLGLGAAAVPSFAQSTTTTTSDGQVGLSLNAAPPAPPAAGDQIGLSLAGDDDAMPMDARAMMPMRGGMGMGRGELFVLACSGHGAEMLDAALLHLSYRLDLTTAQKPLFDAFREKALTTETSFADTCKADMPQKTAGTAPDMLARMKSRLSMEQARITAMNEVLPSFEALYNSLTDAQKQALLPHGKGGMWNDDARPMRPMQPNRG